LTFVFFQRLIAGPAGHVLPPVLDIMTIQGIIEKSNISYFVIPLKLVLDPDGGTEIQ
jgi:hypothetical protein